MQTLNQPSKEKEWSQKLLFITSVILIFETITGLSIYLLPFSISNQVMVFLHTILGIVFLIPIFWYQIRHWLIHNGTSMNHFKLTGYIVTFFTLLLSISGIIVTYQALFLSKIDYVWDLIHIISTFGFIAFIIPHIIVILLRDYKARKKETTAPVFSAQKRFSLNTLLTTVLLFTIVGLLIYAYEPVEMKNELPADYSYLYGEDRPFAPSLANTNTGEAFDPKSLSNSKSCGTTESELSQRYQAVLGLDKFEEPLGGFKIKSRFKHVYTECRRVNKTVECLRNNNLNDLGELINQSHDSLSNDYEVSIPEVDSLVKILRENGAMGARIMGAGFGGMVLAYTDISKMENLIERTKKMYYSERDSGNLNELVFPCITADGADVF